MPHCPTCRTEYREGFETCNDCGEPLLPGDLPAEAATPPKSSEQPLRRVVRVSTSEYEPAEGAVASESESAEESEPTSGTEWVEGATIMVAKASADPESELAVLTGRLAEARIPFLVEEDLDSRGKARAGIPGPLPWYHVLVPPPALEATRAIFEEEQEAAREAAMTAFGEHAEDILAEADAEANPPTEEGGFPPGLILALILIGVALIVVLIAKNR